MLGIQLGRRNLSSFQRIAVVEKKRAYYEKKAKEKQAEYHGNQYDKKSGITPNLVEFQNNRTDNETNSKLAKLAGVGKETYRMGAKILNSDNEELKKRVQSGETSISAGYKELTQRKKEEKTNINKEVDNITSSTITKPTTPKTQISEETKQICADLKTEKTKEYLDSIWDYKVAIIECMNADFEMYYDGFVSILNDMENRVTKKELNECIKNAENIVEKMLSAIEKAKNITTKTEE